MRLPGVRRLAALLVLALCAVVGPGPADAAIAFWGGSPIATRGLPLLRQQYVDAVTSLAERVPAMRNAGMTSEQIARTLHAERRALGVTFKDLTPPEKLAEIYARNLEQYGDELGPSFEFLRDKPGKSFEEIIESATRPGGKDLGF